MGLFYRASVMNINVRIFEIVRSKYRVKLIRMMNIFMDKHQDIKVL